MITIRAAVARANSPSLHVETLKLDAIRPDEVLVKLVATGICHTDLAVMHGYFPMPLPMVLGHEGAGVIVQAGPSSGRAIGDPVALSFATCGACPNCAHDHPAYCRSFASLNYTGRRSDGSVTLRTIDDQPVGGAFFGQSSFATHAIVRGRDVVPVPAEMPLKLLGGFGCGFITGAGAVMNVLKPGPGSAIAIIGAGALGFAAMFAAKLAGCARIVMVDRVAHRLALAIELGATHIIDTTGSPLDAFDDMNFDYIVDTSGAGKLVSAAISRLNRGGTCALLGNGPDRQLIIDMVGMIPGKTITGVIAGDADPQRLIPEIVHLFLAGAFPVDRLMQHFPLDRINEAVELTAKGAVIKPVILFD